MLKELIYRLIHMPRSAAERKINIKNARARTRSEVKPKLIPALTPEYGNMGDQIIAVAEKMWLNEFFPDFEIVEYTQTQLVNDKNLALFEAGVKQSDIIFLQGGGNLNDMYLVAENIRRKIITMFPENSIVLFPQSVSFGSSEQSLAIKKETAEIYGKHRKLVICTRESVSLETAQEMFPNNKILLYPDIATFLIGKFSFDKKKSGKIALCFRDDKEKLYSDEELEKAVAELKKDFECVKIDTHVGHPVTKDERQDEVEAMLNRFAEFDLVITDRFHGVIYSAIADTPCVALKSLDHKILAGISWFDKNSKIEFAAAAEDIDPLARKLLSLEGGRTPDFAHEFREMADLIGKQIKISPKKP